MEEAISQAHSYPVREDLSEPFAIRREVFIEEQGVPEAEEYDVFDGQALHLMVYVDEKPAATGRIWHDGSVFKIGRLAVKKEFRGQKIGDLALRVLIYKAFSSGAEELHISAQTYIMLFTQIRFFGNTGKNIWRRASAWAMKVKKGKSVYPSACGAS